MERRDGMPDLVYWGLYGLATRRAAAAFMWGCVLVAASSAVAVAVVSMPEAGWGVGFLFAAAWYWASIRWVDRHSSWDAEASDDASP